MTGLRPVSTLLFGVMSVPLRLPFFIEQPHQSLTIHVRCYPKRGCICKVLGKANSSIPRDNKKLEYLGYSRSFRSTPPDKLYLCASDYHMWKWLHRVTHLFLYFSIHLL